ncbi:acetolactate synthase, large subunit, biosynthetic type [Ammoniphilus oxalaticus]|uniref:Acetolactate synthase n=1 Tax=Ammoniphilus oxalaticus TaxID=66863 RepID=A0A419SIM1_9BACL|nr:biosynthetic-type acetolactate synthase large subunit [Ammoniphilus oxalaticus]RKD23807.1 acetolactate synthase, large subunit, biosynthetic type [Ammoniphilus oxalaticus]
MSRDSALVAGKPEVPPIVQGEVISGADALLRCLLLEEVEFIFGYPGGAVLPIYDSIYGSHLQHVLTRHEQGAIHAADGYARATGKPGVVIATSGPGATNLVTGIATAQMDSIPMVVITGNVSQDMIGTDAFQEADITGITLPITKHNFFVRSAEELPRVMKEAFYIATTGRPGPVLVDIPKDVNIALSPFYYPETVSLRGYNPTVRPNKMQVERLIKAISEAEKPVIIAGGGVIASGAEKELLEFAEKTQIPVVCTFMGLGGFPGTHPLAVGWPGMHGNYASNQALMQCDLLIGIGNRFDDRITMGRTKEFAPNAKIVHIDIDPAEIGKNVDTFIPIVGDVKLSLEAALPKAQPAKSKEWIEQIDAWQEEYPFAYQQNGKLKPQAVIEMFYETTNGDAIVTTDVGQHQMWVTQYYKFNQPRSLISSGGLGTMGFGLPAAMGAQLAFPDRTVISVNGDGGFQMNSQELAILSGMNIPVKVVIINNKSLGMVRQWQELFYENRLSEIDLTHSPDFVKLAEAYGVKGLRAETDEEAQQVWAEALAHDGPVVVEFVIDKNENVYPMVASGSTLDEMVMGDEK